MYNRQFRMLRLRASESNGGNLQASSLKCGARSRCAFVVDTHFEVLPSMVAALSAIRQ